MQVDNDKKIDILLAILKERYDAAHKMRERSFRFSIWLMGFAIAFIWLIVKESPLITLQQIVMTAFIILMSILFWYFVFSIQRGFNNNWHVMIKVEESLGCWEKDFFGHDALYPEKYRTTKNASSHFKSLYYCLFILCAVSVALIWIPCKNIQQQASITTKCSQVGPEKDSLQIKPKEKKNLKVIQ